VPRIEFFCALSICGGRDLYPELGPQTGTGLETGTGLAAGRCLIVIRDKV
jgi:hypothetical protein